MSIADESLNGDFPMRNDSQTLESAPTSIYLNSVITIRLDAKKAKKLLAAMAKGTFDKLTPAQADALDDFMVELQIWAGGKL
jgi:hypothetical protein